MTCPNGDSLKSYRRPINWQLRRGGADSEATREDQTLVKPHVTVLRTGPGWSRERSDSEGGGRSKCGLSKIMMEVVSIPNDKSNSIRGRQRLGFQG